MPLSHLHPIAVHFPIVFALCLAAFDLVAVVSRYEIVGRSVAARISAVVAVLAGISAVITYSLGDMAYDIAVASGVPTRTLEMHESLGTWTAVVLVIWAAVRGAMWWRGRPLGTLTYGILAVELIVAALVVTTAYFGGHLVYDLGVNVAAR